MCICFFCSWSYLLTFLRYFGTVGVVYHIREKRFCDYNHDSLTSVPETEGDLACLLNWRWNRYFSMCSASFFYTETVEDRRVICSPKACRKYLFICCFTRPEPKPTRLFPVHWILFGFFIFIKAGRMFLANNEFVKKCSFEEATCRIESNLVNRFSWERNRKHS